MDVCSRRARRAWRASVVAAGAGLLVVPAATLAATAPVITAGPAITGTPLVGAELVAVAQWTGDPKPVATWVWERCAKATGACVAIAGATSERYRVVDDVDLGTYLRVVLRVTNSAGYKQARSKPTTVVLPGPEPTPTATPEPTATPAPSATPDPTPEPAPVPAAAVAPAPAVVVPLVPLRFDPFPVVRIKGRLTTAGARVTLLTVRAPRDVTIAVDCAGSDCPARHFAVPAGQHRLRRFERDLKAGTRLEIRVTKPGYVGKFTSFVIRRRAEPRRLDRCLNPGATRPVTCVPG